MDAGFEVGLEGQGAICILTQIVTFRLLRKFQLRLPFLYSVHKTIATNLKLAAAFGYSGLGAIILMKWRLIIDI